MPRIATALLLALLTAGCATVSVQRDGPVAAAQVAGDLQEAEAAYAAGDAEKALRHLDLDPAQVPDELRARWHPLRAKLLEQSGEAFAAAGELAYADAALPAEQRAGNAAEIDRLLSGLADDDLSQRSAALPDGNLLYPHAGRALTRRGLPLPRPYDRGAWQIAADRPPAESDGYRPPNRVGVLLPLSGSLASAGASVRDGFLAAWYAETRRRPEIRFYDAEAAGGAAGAYQKAAAEGVDFVVGPLSRESVASLFSQTQGAVPMLALNRATVPPPPGSASFSMAPEDEGVAAAERLLRRGLKRMVAIVGSDETARRSLKAFGDRLRERGGEVVAEIALVGAGPDYAAMLRPGAMQAQQGGGFDAMFFALKAPQARLLTPQLPAAGLGGRPIVATSLILSGGSNVRLDKELDGIEYPELPWLVQPRAGLPDAASLARTLPSARGNAIRLFAFGADAWKLTAYLEHLAQSPESSLAGATGELKLDGFGNVTRTPTWAVFSGGRPRSALDGALIPQPVETMPGAGEPAAEPGVDEPDDDGAF